MIRCHICGEKDNPVKETEKHCVSCGNPAQDKNSRWYAWTKADLVAKIEKLEAELAEEKRLGIETLSRFFPDFGDMEKS